MRTRMSALTLERSPGPGLGLGPARSWRARLAALLCALALLSPAAARADFTNNNDLIAAIEDNDEAGVRLAVVTINPNSRHEDGTPAVVLAAEARNPAIVEILLKAGARPDASAKDGRTALSLAAQYGLARIARLLIDAGADVEKPGTNREPPLIKAVRERQIEVASILLAAGADPEASDSTGLAARDIAGRQNDPRLIALFEVQ